MLLGACRDGNLMRTCRSPRPNRQLLGASSSPQTRLPVLLPIAAPCPCAHPPSLRLHKPCLCAWCAWEMESDCCEITADTRCPHPRGRCATCKTRPDSSPAPSATASGRCGVASPCSTGSRNAAARKSESERESDCGVGIGSASESGWGSAIASGTQSECVGARSGRRRAAAPPRGLPRPVNRPQEAS